MIAFLFWLSVILILYTYAGYPLALALLARVFSRRRRPSTVDQTAAEESSALPTVTLLIAAYNEQMVLRARLQNALELDYPADRLQILVAADGSTDDTVKIAESFAPRVEVAFLPERRGKMAAVDRAMGLARGEIVVMSDANNFYQPGCLRHLVAPFSDPRVGVVTGGKSILKGDGVLGESEGLYWKYEAFIKKQETRLGCTTGVAGEILALRRSIYQPSPSWVINDDFYIAISAIRRGYDVVYAPLAVSYERVSASASDEMTRRARIVAGRFQMMAMAGQVLPWKRPLVTWQIISHKFLRPLVPLAMAGALLANLAAVIWTPEGWQDAGLGGSGIVIGALRLAPPYNGIFLAIQIIFYLAAWAGSRFNLPGPAGKLLYLPTFLVNSNLATLAGLYRFATRRQSSIWQRVARRDEASQ